MKPLQGSCVSKHWRCGVVQIVYALDEPSTGILRVEALLLWCGANSLRPDGPCTGILRVRPEEILGRTSKKRRLAAPWEKTRRSRGA